MNHVFRKPRLVLFAASAAIVAGGVLAPATALAATPAHSHAVRADDTTGNESTLLHRSGPDDTVIRTDPPAEDTPGKWGNGKPGKRPGKHDPVRPPVFQAPDKPEWQCVRAPCGPPEEVLEGELFGGAANDLPNVSNHART
ncbi:hypothetical protein ACE1OC_26370 [Streptomyces sp. DSM 116496]|uniref:hypothetical protein n=1 Tax=Streptomyces stoeckheimensis TaxID=3344656 RepID=UPI0038B2C705